MKNSTATQSVAKITHTQRLTFNEKGAADE